MKLLVHRLMRKLGVSVQRSRDPYVEIAEMLQGMPVKNIVDGGALYGGHAARFLQLWPSATVHAFEPRPDTLARLKQNFTGNNRVRIYGCALAESVGEAQFQTRPARPRVGRRSSTTRCSILTINVMS